MTIAQSEDIYPEFRINKSRFDQSTFYGRWRHFMDIIDPRTLLVSQVKLEECVSLLEKFKAGTLPLGVTNKDLWEAQKVKQAIIHPDTEKKVFMPFRMSGFVPFGSPIVVGLLLPNPTLASTIFWQWLNQSHNACVNYANRNASKPTPMIRFTAGYTGAVTTAVSIALSLNVLIKSSSTFSPTTKLLVQRFVPFPAVALASTCNVLLMRNSELTTGIDVVDKNDNVIGSSKIAAKKALQETALTRIFLPAPILVIPPALMAFLEKTKFLKNNPRLHLPIHAFLVTACFGLALPVAIAIFPQYSKIAKSRLEPELQRLTTEAELYYNKGL